MKCLRLTWKGGEVTDHYVGKRGAWDASSWTVGRWWWKIAAAADMKSRTRMQQWWWKIAAAAADMKSRTIHVGTRTAERGAEQEDEEDGRLSTSTASLQSWFRDAASTPGLMSFDPGSVDAVARNFYPLRRCPASCLGAVAMLYPDKQEKCNWRNEGITIVKQE
jgi:hypothetical protein